MFRSIVLFCIFCFALVLGAADFPAGYTTWRFAGDFKVYHDNTLTKEDAAQAVFGKPVKNLAAKTVPASTAVWDLNALFGYTQCVPGRIAVAVNKLVLDAPGRIQLGVGADWHIAVFIDGKMVFDTYELGGNGRAPARADDHVIDVKLSSGEHTAVFWLSSGATTWTVAAGHVPYTKVIYPVPALKYGPCFDNVTSVSAKITFTTTEPAPCGVEVRSTDGKFRRLFWSHTGYQIDASKTLHRIQLDGLDSDTKYICRAVYLERPQNELKYIGKKEYTFSTGSRKFKPFKMFFTGDLQFLPDVQRKILDRYTSLAHFADSDFFVSLGDSSGAFHNFEYAVFDVALKSVLEKSGHSKKLIMVRGNHEYRGNETLKFTRFFDLKNGNCFGVYYYNQVAFVILDSGNGANRSRAFTRHYSAYDLPDELLAAQRKELAREVKSEAWKSAKYRVVLSHGAYYGAEGSLEKYIRKITGGIIRDGDIQLWLSGHIHKYRRTVPGRAGYFGFSTYKAGEKDFLSGKYPFATVIIDGPGGVKPHSCHTVEFTDKGIKVNSFFEDGKPFDSFETDKTGRVIKSAPSGELKFFDVK